MASLIVAGSSDESKSALKQLRDKVSSSGQHRDNSQDSRHSQQHDVENQLGTHAFRGGHCQSGQQNQELELQQQGPEQHHSTLDGEAEAVQEQPRAANAGGYVQTSGEQRSAWQSHGGHSPNQQPQGQQQQQQQEAKEKQDQDWWSAAGAYDC